MERVGVRELRQNLSVYLRRVRAGESLQVTERGRPVALLQPLVEANDAAARLEARGLTVRRPRGDLAELPPPPQVDLAIPLAQALDEQREERL